MQTPPLTIDIDGTPFVLDSAVADQLIWQFAGGIEFRERLGDTPTRSDLASLQHRLKEARRNGDVFKPSEAEDGLLTQGIDLWARNVKVLPDPVPALRDALRGRDSQPPAAA